MFCAQKHEIYLFETIFILLKSTGELLKQFLKIKNKIYYLLFSLKFIFLLLTLFSSRPAYFGIGFLIIITNPIKDRLIILQKCQAAYSSVVG